jgi:uncharacterized protein (TIGR02266 family)
MVQPDDSVSDVHEPSAAAFDGRHPPRRLPLQTPVTVLSQQGTHAGLAANLGIGGLFVATREPRLPGERVRVLFTIPSSGARFEAEAEVRWVRERPSETEPALVAGMGLKFLELSADARHAVEVFLRQGAALSGPHAQP